MSNFQTSCHVIVPAAGSGSRFGAQCPKQYLPLLGQPLIFHTLTVLCQSPDVTAVWVVLSPDDRNWDDFDGSWLGPRLQVLRCGGATRAASVSNGLMHLQQLGVDPAAWVLVHDAARPCLSAAGLKRLIETLRDDPVGGLLAVPVADTLKRAGEQNVVIDTVAREGLWQAQTPQMFRLAPLLAALQQYPTVTDEAGAMEAAGFKPRLVASESFNLKVTYPADLALAAAILQSRQAAPDLAKEINHDV